MERATINLLCILGDYSYGHKNEKPPITLNNISI